VRRIQLKKRNRAVLRRKRLVLRVLMLVSLAVAAFCLAIALSWIANQPAAQTLQVKNSTSEVLTTGTGTHTEQTASPSPTSDAQSSTPNLTSTAPTEEQPVKTFLVPGKYQGKIVRNVKLSNKEKVIALTFDDGPWPNTTVQVLDILKKNDIKATFFWIGRMVQESPEIAKRVVAEGHVIGNHTWSHSYRWMNKAAAAREIDRTADLMYETTGVKTLYFRPPGGILTNGVADYAQQKNYSVVMWSNDSIDYRPFPAKRLVNNVLRKVKQSDIVLMHDGGGNRSATVKALPEIISTLKQRGYKFVTIPELLEMEIKAKEAAAKSQEQDVKGEEKDSSAAAKTEAQGVKDDEKDSTVPVVKTEEQGVKAEEQYYSNPSSIPDSSLSPETEQQQSPVQ
jgi:peptidoglycan-N-acetylglucosamine deacetylase